jgi:serine/threonine protein kinase
LPVNTLGRYKIIREIARSNDVVYEAVDTGINRRIALKELLLPPNQTGVARRERVERFYREARAAGLLAHPNIVTIYEAGEDNGRHFIAMEYLEGQTLRDVLEIEHSLTVDRATEITRQVLHALGYAHANGVVHRDIKPDNIQILPDGQVKITDFGIARIMEEPTLTADGQVFGTPSYMSPEQVAGKPLDGRTDLFSLGIVLFEMLCGRKPFTGDSVVTITYNIMNQEVMVPGNVPPHLERVIKKATEKDPNMRWSSAAEMEAALDPASMRYSAPVASPSTSWPSPLNVTIQAPGSIYGPMNAPPGSPPPIPSPDPFANLNAGGYSIPRAPSRPLVSSDTLYFFKVFFVVLLALGFVLFLLWSFMTAYQNSQQMSHLGDINTHIKAGTDYYKQQSYESAIGEYKTALVLTDDPKLKSEINTDIADCYISMGDDEYHQGNMDRALRLWESAESTSPNDVNAMKRISQLYLDLGNKAESSGDIQSALSNWQKAQVAGPGTSAGIEAGKNILRVSPSTSSPGAGD